MNLVIVESPTKAKTIQRFLPADFNVRSSYGHVRDLPRKELGVDTENNFEPKYVVPLLARKRLTEIKKALEKSKKVILATDEDREGEAIAWHLIQALGLNGSHQLKKNKAKKNKAEETEEKKPKATIERIVFHEITKNAILEALKNPRTLDMDLVNAQQARRILDRLVGYKLSPFLWKKVAKGLSAGRVQSVAVRLIVEREREIQKFQPQEYWTISAWLKKQKLEEKFEAQLAKKNGQALEKLEIKDETEAKKILENLENAIWHVEQIESKELNRHPSPPFTTSTLQQEAGKKLGFSAKQTMQIAQQLYEGVESGEGQIGLITYMRTDSLNLSSDAVADIRKKISGKFGPDYLSPVPQIFKTKTKGAQEAHEAIRPTEIQQEPENIKKFLTPYQFKLYNLIWKRTLACQMAPAVLSITSIDIEAKKENEKNFYTFRASGTQIKFDGFLKVYPGKINEVSLPKLAEKEILELEKLTPLQHFTEPPARYSEATLIKTLEENGIGRPSTYAPTISTILERNYVQKNEQRRLQPTDIGFLVNDMLVEHFPQIVDINFTAHLEEELDEIAKGEKEWTEVLKEFYGPFNENLEQKYQEVEKQKAEPEKTDRLCPQCSSPVLIRTSRFGKFYACSNFPKCRFTENIKNSLNLPCPKCVEGEVVEKRTKRGKVFYGCSRYPECDFALWDKPIGQKCPDCGAPMVLGKKGEKCSNKECKPR